MKTSVYLSLSNPIHIAAVDGDLSLLISLHERGHEMEMEMEWNEDTIAWAAYGGSLECLQYLHTHGVRWNTKTTNYAAVSGSFECLKYALLNGCPYILEDMLFSLNVYSSCIDFDKKHSWLQDFLFPHVDTPIMLRDLTYVCREKMTKIAHQHVTTELMNKLPLDVIKYCMCDFIVYSKT